MSGGGIRKSASLVLFDASFRVLLIGRIASGSFAGASVFPGGNFDTTQDASTRLCAIRECFEESGVLYVKSAALPSSSVLHEARQDIHAGKLRFSKFLTDHNLVAAADELEDFSTWVTPVNLPKRFRTSFYLGFLPRKAERLEETLPTSDGGKETISARFVSPADALDLFRRKQITLFPPQFYILSAIEPLLKESSPRKALQEFARSGFGDVVFTPKPIGKLDNGTTILAYNGDEKCGGKQGDRNRMLVKFSKLGPQEIEHIQNVDPRESSIQKSRI